jgi:hypothetical protein
MCEWPLVGYLNMSLKLLNFSLHVTRNVMSSDMGRGGSTAFRQLSVFVELFYGLRKIPVIVFQSSTLPLGSRYSIVDIATGCGLDDQGVGVRVQVGSRNFPSPRPPYRLWGPPSLLYSEADHSFPASAEVKKIWIYTSTPPYAFTALCLLS